MHREPCPTCGSSRINRDDFVDIGESQHWCNQCGVRGPRVRGYDAALEGWNRLARLREALHWRTVSADGLPAPRQLVLLKRTGSELELGAFDANYDRWKAPGLWLVKPTDQWLPVPGETP